MKLQSLTIIFIIIIIPIILVTSFYIQMQIDVMNLQSSYDQYLYNSVKAAISAFEINTVEWNYVFSNVADSKRRDVLASVNTFTTTLANDMGIRRN
jgi:5-bromo-4-chloroindolyl phosphate hydrolysis protein